MTNIIIDSTDPSVFQHALASLRSYAQQPKPPRTQNFAVAIAALMYRDFADKDALPSLVHGVGGQAISTTALQRQVCDALYTKDVAFIPTGSQGNVYKPLTDSFKPTSVTSNNWRNSFDLQMGLSCDAPPNGDFLLSARFLAEPRFDCIYRNAVTGGCSSPSGNVGTNRTCFNPNKKDVPGLSTRASMTPKLLHRGTNDDGVSGYWIIEPTVEVLMDLLGDPANRVPLYPFMAALYCGSTALMTVRPTVTAEIFQKDLHLDDERFSTLFDPYPHSASNAAFLYNAGLTPDVQSPFVIVQQIPVNSEQPHGADPNGEEGLDAAILSDSVLAQPSEEQNDHTADFELGHPYTPNKDLKAFAKAAVNFSNPQKRLELLEQANRGHARALDQLYSSLSAHGYDCREQYGGYDLIALRDQSVHLFEVKTWRPENLNSQIRSAVAQLYEYRWINRGCLANASLYVVLDHPPPHDDGLALSEYLHDDREILLCWIDEGALCTFPQYSAQLPVTVTSPSD